MDELVPALEDLVRRTAAAESRAPAVWLHVHAPRLPLRWQGGAGPAANPAGPPAPSLRIASNTKTFVAAAVLRLVEDDALDLDTPLARLSPPATVATLRAAGDDGQGDRAGGAGQPAPMNAKDLTPLDFRRRCTAGGFDVALEVRAIASNRASTSSRASLNALKAARRRTRVVADRVMW
jgi:CubicO group peptidase (beta-lactamase class C family)